MNNLTITLSSNTTALTATSPEYELEDVTDVTISLADVDESVLPRTLVIDWGDGSPVFVDIEGHLKHYRTDTIINEVLYGKLSPIFGKNYNHVYSPSETSLTKELTAQVYIEYTNDEVSLFYIPMVVRVGSFYESIGDINLINTNLIPISSNNVNFTFSTEKGGYIIEASS